LTDSEARLLNRNTLLLIQGQVVSQIGSQMFAVASFFWIKHTTGSASLLGLLMMVLALPGVLLGPLAGTLVDRHSRRAIIVGCDVLDGLVLLALFALTRIFPDASELLVPALFVVTALIGAVAAFFQPAVAASLPDLVPASKVAPANSLLQATVQLAMFIGQGLGGVLFRLLGAPLLFLVDGVSYLLSAASESFMRIPQKLAERGKGWRTTLREVKAGILEGLRHVRGRPGLKLLLLASTCLNFFLMPVITLLPFYVEDFLHATADWYGFLMAAFGAGTLVGNVAAGGLSLAPRRRRNAILAAMLLFACTQIVLSRVGQPLGALAVVVAGGVLDGFVTVNLITLIQISTPSEIRGRVFGLLTTLAGATVPLGMALGGFVADLTGQNVPAIYLACGAMGVVLTLAAAASPAFRGFLAYEAQA
jgi:MFS family permease